MLCESMLLVKCKKRGLCLNLFDQYRQLEAVRQSSAPSTIVAMDPPPDRRYEH
jgi:hypothetical protein